MTPYIFFLDIDGTILHKRMITQEVIDAISEAQRQGHKVFLNTGRSFAYLPDEVKPIPFDGVVCGCGAYIICDGTVILNEGLSQENSWKLCRRFSQPNDPGVLLEGVDSMVIYRKSLWHKEANWQEAADEEELISLLNTTRITKASILGDIDPKIIPELEKDFFVIWHSTEHYTECAPKGCTKGTGILQVMDHYGLPAAASVAIGDSENDLEMLQTAGTAVVMGQARDEIKAYADRITETVQNDGAALAIRELIQTPLP